MYKYLFDWLYILSNRVLNFSMKNVKLTVLYFKNVEECSNKSEKKAVEGQFFG